MGGRRSLLAGVSKGAAGEVLAARFLRSKGYTILVSNYRTRFGEIDIIAVDAQYIAFVEVKTRSEDAYYQDGRTLPAQFSHRFAAAVRRAGDRHQKRTAHGTGLH